MPSRALLDEFIAAVESGDHAGANAVKAWVQVNAGLNRFFAQIGPARNFNFFVLFRELDNWHVFDRNREPNLRKN